MRCRRVADALPGFGIVAAVLGIVTTMAAIDGASTSEIGHKVGAALVGTFLGILVAYGFVGPIAAAMEGKAHEEARAFEVVKMALVASVRGYPPPVAVEFARKLLSSQRAPQLQGPGPGTAREEGRVARGKDKAKLRPIIIVKRKVNAAAAITAAPGRSPTRTS